MIFEFTGCTGSGKTTISGAVIKKLTDRGIDVVSVHPRFFRMPLGILRRVKKETAQNLILDLLAYSYLITHIKEQKEVLAFAGEVLREYSESFFERINLYRSVLRKVGVQGVLSSKRYRNKVVLVDEGVVHAIHNIFVHQKRPGDLKKLEEFADMIKLPTGIIYVRSSVDVLIERSKKRRDLTRRVSLEGIPDFVNNANMVFEHFMYLNKLKKQVFTVDNNGNDPQGGPRIDEIAKEIVSHILKESRV